MTRTHALSILILLFGFSRVVLAQDTVAVPDLTGLSVPEAATLLNRSRLALGVETGEAWTPESGLEQNRIKSQSIPARSSDAPVLFTSVRSLSS